MPLYQYTAATRDGHTVQGELEAATGDDLKSQLLENKLLLLGYRRTSLAHLTDFNPFRSTMSIKDKIAFTRQLKVLLKAGLPMPEALETLIEQDTNPKNREIIRQLHTSIREGHSLSDAMNHYPEIFPNFFRYSIKAGEKSGSLEPVLERLSTHLERVRRTQGKIFTALIYPAVLTLVAAAVIVFLITHVVPTFSGVFSDLDAELPGSTRLLLILAGGLRYHLPLLALLAVIVFFLYRATASTTSGRMALGRLLLRIPVLGPISLKYAATQMCRTFATLLGSGVPMVNALSTTALTLNNRYLASGLDRVVKGLNEGRTLASGLADTRRFPVLMLQMVRVGEKTGALEEVLETVSSYYEEEVDVALESLVAVLEPLLMILMGSIVGFIVLAMFLPILQMGVLVRS